MQSQQVSSTDRLNYHELTKSVKTIKKIAILLLFLTVILVTALIVSIAVIFTVGLKSAQQSTNTSVNPFYQPCACGCPSIEPSFNNTTRVAGRIVHGETARAHSWPWQMLLLIFNENATPIYMCGATLISDRHILTAAHCVHKHFSPSIRIFSGQQTLNLNITPTSGYAVNRIFIHEGYNNILHHDIAILTVEKPLRLEAHVYPICLATPKSPALQDRDELISTGWGRLTGKPNTTDFPASLQQVRLTYMSTSHPNCSRIFQDRGGAHPGQMCVGKPGYNICQGDSGGPLVRKLRISNTERYYWQQVGIVSATVDCGWNSTYPDVFVNIPYYYDWIVSTIKRAD